MKKCISCNDYKNDDSFYNHPQTKDGKSNKCKDCSKNYAKERLQLKMEDPEFAIEGQNHNP